MRPHLHTILLLTITLSVSVCVCLWLIPSALAETPTTMMHPTTTQNSGLRTQDSTTSAPAPLDPKWADLLARLSIDAPATREAAEKELAALPRSDHSSVKLLAAHAPDPALKSRLTKIAQDMEIDEAIDPPPLSIDVTNASLSDIITYLNKAISSSMEVWPPNDATGRCTLKMTDASFWDILTAVSQQLPIRFQGWNSKLRIENDHNPLANLVHVKGLAIFPTAINRSSTIDYQQPLNKQPQPAQFNLTFTVVADPRMKIASASPPEFTEVTDDAGNTLYKHPYEKRGFWDRGGVWTQSYGFPVPKNVGTKITSAKGAVCLLVALDTQTLEIPDFEKVYKDPIVINGKTVKFSKFEVKENNIEFNANLDRSKVSRFSSSESDPNITMAFIDANDKEIWSSQLRGGSSGSVGGNNITPPVRLRLTCPTRTKEVTIPFELKDIPLPTK